MMSYKPLPMPSSGPPFIVLHNVPDAQQIHTALLIPPPSTTPPQQPSHLRSSSIDTQDDNSRNVLVKKSLSLSRRQPEVRVVLAGGRLVQRVSSARLSKTCPNEPSTSKRVELSLSCRSLPPTRPTATTIYRPLPTPPASPAANAFYLAPTKPTPTPPPGKETLQSTTSTYRPLPNPPASPAASTSHLTLPKLTPAPPWGESLESIIPLLQPVRKHPTTRKPISGPSLSLQTAKPFKPIAEEKSAVSPLPPDIPIAPSPSTARRKRISKLRRHLGKSLPVDCVDDLPNLRARLAVPPHIQQAPRHDRLNPRQVQNVVLPPRISEEDSDSATSAISEDDKLKTSERIFVRGGTSFKDVPLNRFSKKWVVEKGGNRRVEGYGDVIRRLRSL
ncbi:hypothetical protein BDN72DRAFT_831952 [Pluteus cervinus]|uniref:Uncharacterized protein n=1 Tax=Pluteus cervinus TaxID=181527 RepID=A0ACD3BDC2_9AGAR|nr:hypothetical protein BDN72DRAFT_831952 [Pluteus cervinus]